jgi:TP901 family phage tail tape measure protein
VPAANTVAQMQVLVTADTSAAEKGLTDLGTKVGSAGSMLTTAFTGAAVAGIAAVGAGLASAVTSAADFETKMSAVKAVSGATSGEMEQLSGLALQLGKDTSFSASEAASGIEELVKGGLTIPDIMNGAAQATLDLAAAGGVSLPDAATIAANALAEFNLKGSDMAHVADLIAGAANASALDVSDFKFSLSAAGAVAATVGFSFDDLAQGIAVMGKAGITGSDAGTSLKTMMMNLVPATNKAADTMRELGIITGDSGPVMDKLKASLASTALGQGELAKLTKSGLISSEEDLFKALDKVNPALTQGASSATDYGVKVGLLGNQFFDANGKVKSMADVAEVLKGSLAGMSQEQEIATLRTLFGSDAIRAASVLAKEGAAGFNEMADAMGAVSSKDVGTEKLNNLNGSIEQLKGSLETMAITVGIQLLPILKDFVDAITQAANDALPSMDAAAKSLAATLAAWAPTLKAVAAFLWDHRDAVVAVVAALGTFVILTTVVGWITTIIGVVTTVSTVIGTLSAVIGGSSGVIAALGALVAILGGPVTIAIAAIALLIGAFTLAWVNDWGGIQEKTAAVVTFLSGVPAMVSGFFDEIGKAAEGLQLAVSDAWTAIKDDTTTIWNGITTFLTDWWREILVALTGPIGLVAVLVYDNWTTISTTTQTVFDAIKNILIAVWGLIETDVFQPALNAIVGAVDTAWQAISTKTHDIFDAVLAYIRDNIMGPISEAVTTSINATRDAFGLALDAISTKAHAVFDPILAYIRDNIFGPIGEAVTTSVNAARDAFAAALDAISTKAHAVLDPILTYIRDTIFSPIQTAVETAMGAVSSAFQTSVDAVKSTVDSTLGGIKNVWETTWRAIQTAAESPAQAMNELITLVGKLKDIMPEWLIPHSPTPFQIGLEGIMKAAQAANSKVSGFLAGTGKVPGALDDWLNAAIGVSGVGSDWLDGLRWLAMHESTGNPKAVNPFDVEGVMNGPGPHAMGLMQTIPSTFRAYRNKDLPDDIFDPVANATASIAYIKDTYGSIQNVISGWERRGGYAAGGWAGLHGPELAWLGEGGPEYVVPNSQVRSDAGMGASQTLTLNVAIGGKIAETIYITGRELAIKRAKAQSMALA